MELTTIFLHLHTILQHIISCHDVGSEAFGFIEEGALVKLKATENVVG